MLSIWFNFRSRTVSAVSLGLLIGSFSAFAAETDNRAAYISCLLDKNQQLVECDYRHPASLGVKEVSLSIGGVTVQIPEKGLISYPAPQQSTALLFLVDVSDPKRKQTVEKKNVQAITEMLDNIKSHHKVGLAVFDSDIRTLSPISSDVAPTIAAVKALKATGQSTEFYKNILESIAILEKTNASRKGLIIMSDGKAEDSAYKHEDVVKAARDAEVVILGIGYQENAKDSPFLQKLRRLSEDTYGLYFDGTTIALPLLQTGKPFSFVEKGGRVSFEVGKVRGKQPVTLVLGITDSKPLELKAEIDFPDKRSRSEYAIDFGKQYWPALLAGLFLFISLVIVFLRYRRHKKLLSIPPAPYAMLFEMSGPRTQYELIKTAIQIGRSSENDICLENDTISSRHAEIQLRRTGDVFIVDLASANGVYVNEAKVTQSQLFDGDVIELGEVRLRFAAK